MAKVAPLMFLVAILLLSSSLVLSSARPEPPFREDASLVKTKLPDGTNYMEEEEEGGSCEGVGDESEECLMRRTLAAHLDYIYTQKQKP